MEDTPITVGTLITYRNHTGRISEGPVREVQRLFQEITPDGKFVPDGLAFLESTLSIDRPPYIPEEGKIADGGRLHQDKIRLSPREQIDHNNIILFIDGVRVHCQFKCFYYDVSIEETLDRVMAEDIITVHPYM